jgi:hypothetical protein
MWFASVPMCGKRFQCSDLLTVNCTYYIGVIMTVLRHFAITTRLDNRNSKGKALFNWRTSMKVASQIIIAALATYALEHCTLAKAAEGNPIVPAALSVPDGYLVKLKFNASGVQIYRCLPSTQNTNQYNWSFIAPEAKLYSETGDVTGTHYAGPTWEVSDGRKVVGKLSAKTAASDGTSIPWLLLTATEEHADKGIDKIAFVQRLNTKGGSAPASGCSNEVANTEVRIPYSADYYFYAKR